MATNNTDDASASGASSGPTQQPPLAKDTCPRRRFSWSHHRSENDSSDHRDGWRHWFSHPHHMHHHDGDHHAHATGPWWFRNWHDRCPTAVCCCRCSWMEETFWRRRCCPCRCRCKACERASAARRFSMAGGLLLLALMAVGRCTHAILRLVRPSSPALPSS